MCICANRIADENPTTQKACRGYVLFVRGLLLVPARLVVPVSREASERKERGGRGRPVVSGPFQRQGRRACGIDSGADLKRLDVIAAKFSIRKTQPFEEL